MVKKKRIFWKILTCTDCQYLDFSCQSIQFSKSCFLIGRPYACKWAFWKDITPIGLLLFRSKISSKIYIERKLLRKKVSRSNNDQRLSLSGNWAVHFTSEISSNQFRGDITLPIKCYWAADSRSSGTSSTVS